MICKESWILKSEEWSSQLISNLSNWKEEAWKNQGFNRIQTRDLRDTSAMLYQLSYEATHWERGQFIEFIFPVRSKMMWSIYEIIHIWTAVVDESEEWSLQLISNLSNWREEAWKIQAFNRIQTCDLRDTGAMLYQLSYEATHWEWGQFIEYISPVRSEVMWSTYEIIHIWTAVVDESEEWSSQLHQSWILLFCFCFFVFIGNTNAWVISYFRFNRKTWHKQEGRKMQFMMKMCIEWHKNKIIIIIVFLFQEKVTKNITLQAITL